jgi:hypothetical protein
MISAICACLSFGSRWLGPGIVFVSSLAPRRPGSVSGRTAQHATGVLAAPCTGLSPAGDDKHTHNQKHNDITLRCHLSFCQAFEKP